MPEGALDWIRVHAHRLVWLAIAAGFLFRLQGLGWDDWRQFHPDERNLVTGAAQLAFPGAVISDFHAYNGLALALPKLLAWFAYGPSPDGAAITWAARWISAIASGASIWVAAAIVRRLDGEIATVLAAAMLASSAPLIQWAHFGTTESLLVLALLSIWLISIRFLDGAARLWPTAILIGLAGGLALGVKTSAGAFALIPLTVAAMRWRVYGARLILPGVAALALAGAIFVATTPSLVFATRDYLATMDFESGVVSGRLDVFWTWQFADAPDGWFELVQLWGLLDGGGLVLAAVGVFLAIRRRAAAVAPALVFLAIYCALIFGWHAKFARYLAPIIPLLLIFAAIGAAGLLERSGSRAFAAATLGTLAVFAVSGLTFAASYQSADPRIAAAERLRGQLYGDETILFEPVEVGPTDFAPHQMQIIPLIDPAGAEKTASMAEAIAAGDWVVIYSRRHWGVLPRLAGRFPEACAYYTALFDGRLGFEKAFTFRRNRVLDGLFRPAETAEETRVVFDRPEVMIFEKRTHRSADEIRALLEAEGPTCPASADAGEK